MDDTFINAFYPEKQKSGQPYTFNQVKSIFTLKKIKLISPWINLQTRSTWQCLKCNYIWKTKPAKIVNGTSCAKCYGNIPLTNQIVDQRIIELKLPLTRISDWTGYTSKMLWKCSKCNHEWYSKPGNILQQHTSCPNCRTPSYSKRAISWLTEIEKTQNIKIQHAEQIGEYTIPGTKLKVDGFCKETNTIYEFYGDIFHGNPKLFKLDQFCSPYHKKTANELYQQTVTKEQQIKAKGYNLVTIWENEYVNTRQASSGIF